MISILTTGGTIEGLDYVDESGITSSNVGIEDFLNNNTQILIKQYLSRNQTEDKILAQKETE